MSGLFDFFFSPWQASDPWAGLTAAALTAALLTLLAYRLAGNPERIRSARNHILAHLLEVRLYRREPRTVLKVQGLLLAHTMRYLLGSLPPLLLLAGPLGVLLVQLDLRFSRLPLVPGAAALVKVRLEPGALPGSLDAALHAGPGLLVETPPLRIDSEAEIDWRIRAVEAGIRTVEIRIGSEVEVKSVAVGLSGIPALPAERGKDTWTNRLFLPGESKLPAGSRLRSIEVVYPERTWQVFGLRMSWLSPFLLLLLLFTLLLRIPWRIEL